MTFNNNNCEKSIFSLTPNGTRAKVQVDQFRYIKIQPKTIDLGARLWGVTTEFVEFTPRGLMLKSVVLGWIVVCWFVHPKELVSFGPWHVTRSRPIGKMFVLAMIFLRDSLCLSAVSLSRERYDTLVFPVVHWQAFCMWHWPIGKDLD